MNPAHFTVTPTMRLTKIAMDYTKLWEACAKAKRSSMMRAGAFVRGAARRLLRRRKAPSAPGSPPHVHTGSSEFGLRTIRFDYNAGSETCVVGPVGTRGSPWVVPQALEFGGAKMVKSRRQRGKTVLLKIASRSFMGPALERARDKIPSAWAGSVRG